MTELFHLEPSAPQEKPKRPPIITPKRRKILDRLKKQPTITLDEAIKLIGDNIYANERFHVGNTLSAMVRAGFLRRLKPGLFERA